MILILFGLFLKHFIADFVLQTKYQWSNKGTFLHPGGLLHSAIHGILTGVFLYFYGYFSIYLIFIDFISHYLIDYCKSNINRKWNYTPDTFMFWFMIGLDQFLHYVIYLIICKKILDMSL